MSKNFIIGILAFWITWGGIKFIRNLEPGFMRIVPQVQITETKLEEYARLSGERLSIPKEVVRGLLRLDTMKSDNYKHFYQEFTVLDTSLDYSDNRDQGVVMVWRLTFVDGSKSFQLVARPEGISSF
jgi:hypothetical protein